MTKVTDYYDTATFLRQLGASLEPPMLQSHGPCRLTTGYRRTVGTALVWSSVAQVPVRGSFARAAEPWALGAALVREMQEEFTGRHSRCRTDQYLKGRVP